MTIDGTMSATGAMGAYGAGGGSGGSILLETNSFGGVGTISANGGGGDFMGGGGAGGRIAVHYDYTSFSGDFYATGGPSSNTNHGGPGTIFQRNRLTTETKLIISNEHHVISTTSITSLEETRGSVAWLMGSSLYEFTEIQLLSKGCLAFHYTAEISFHFLYLFLFLFTLYSI